MSGSVIPSHPFYSHLGEQDGGNTCDHALDAAGAVCPRPDRRGGDAANERPRVRDVLARGEARGGGSGRRGFNGDLDSHLHLQSIKQLCHKAGVDRLMHES